MRSLKTPWVVGIVALVITLTFGGIYEFGQSSARKAAFTEINLLKGGTLGADETADHIAALRQILKDAHGMKPVEVNVTESDLTKFVADANMRTAIADRIALHETRGNAQRAKELHAAFEVARIKSGRTYQELGTSDQELDRQVALNLLDEAKQTRAKIDNSLYRAAGIPVPLQVKTVTKTVRVTPKAKSVAKASQKKKTPVARKKVGYVA